MITYQLKLKLNKTQEKQINEWLFILTGLYNWTSRKIELDAKDKIYHDKWYLQSLIKGHSKKLEIPSHVLRGTIHQVHDAWNRCFKRISKKPKLKGFNNKLTSVCFPDPIKRGDNGKISLHGIGKVKYYKQVIPDGKIKCAIIIKKASGYYLNLIIDTSPKQIIHKNNKVIGIDSGYKTYLTCSDGIKIETKKQFKMIEKRLGQAQRGKNKKLVSRLYERSRNRRRSDAHQLSYDLTANCSEIYFSKDNNSGLSKSGFGKSVSEAAHSQLRTLLAYKMPTSGRQYYEVASKNSTKTCSTCGANSGPSGKAGLSVREWDCGACGAHHDRDINAAMNTLITGLGTSHEATVKVGPKRGVKSRVQEMKMEVQTIGQTSSENG